MKTILKILATLLLVTAISACDGDKDNEPNPENPENPNGGNGGTGSGTAANPFKVANVADLKRVGSNTEGPDGQVWKHNSHYIQIADIDLKGESNWAPITGKMDINLVLTYDGGGYTISNLTITSDYVCIGLFGEIAGTIKNVRLNNVKVSGTRMVGALAGSLFGGGKIEHCYVNNVECNADAYAGGLVGLLSESAKVDFCYVNDVKVSATASVGGLVGQSGSTNTISNCIVTNGTVNGGICGGIAGANSGKVENCYSTLNVSGTEYVGGIIGFNTEYSVTQYCYATGNVTAEKDKVGGIAGLNIISTIESCVALNKTVKKTIIGSNNIGRISWNDMLIDNVVPVNGTLINNYARTDMTLTAGISNVSASDATTTSVHGATVTAANYNGANSATWWKDTAGFPESSWDFAPNRLPHLKGFDKLTQNPTVTP